MTINPLTEEDLAYTFGQIQKLKVTELHEICRYLKLIFSKKRKHEVVDAILKEIRKYGNERDYRRQALAVIICFCVIHHGLGSSSSLDSRYETVMSNPNPDQLVRNQLSEIGLPSGRQDRINSSISAKNIVTSKRHTAYNQIPFNGRGISFKPNPFFTLIDKIGPSPQLGTARSSRQEVVVKFNINKDIREKIDSKQYKVFAFCGRLPTVSSINKEDVEDYIVYPNKFEMHMNDTKIDINRAKGRKDDPSTNLPFDITDYIRGDTNQMNKVMLVFIDATNSFLLYVYLVKIKTVDSIIKETHFKHMSHEQELEKITQYYTSDDDGLSINNIKVTLVDSVNLTRINTPARSIYCQHFQCFDLRIFLQLQELSNSWTCPVCNVKIGLNDLVIPDFFNELVKYSNHKSIIIKEDGKVEEADEDDKKPISSITKSKSKSKSNTVPVEEIIILDSESDENNDDDCEATPQNASVKPIDNYDNAIVLDIEGRDQNNSPLESTNNSSNTSTGAVKDKQDSTSSAPIQQAPNRVGQIVNRADSMSNTRTIEVHQVGTSNQNPNNQVVQRETVHSMGTDPSVKNFDLKDVQPDLSTKRKVSNASASPVQNPENNSTLSNQSSNPVSSVQHQAITSSLPSNSSEVREVNSSNQNNNSNQLPQQAQMHNIEANTQSGLSQVHTQSYQTPINQIPINQTPNNQIPINQIPNNQIPINQRQSNQIGQTQTQISSLFSFGIPPNNQRSISSNNFDRQILNNSPQEQINDNHQLQKFYQHQLYTQPTRLTNQNYHALYTQQQNANNYYDQHSSHNARVINNPYVQSMKISSLNQGNENPRFEQENVSTLPCNSPGNFEVSPSVPNKNRLNLHLSPAKNNLNNTRYEHTNDLQRSQIPLVPSKDRSQVAKYSWKPVATASSVGYFNQRPISSTADSSGSVITNNNLTSKSKPPNTRNIFGSTNSQNSGSSGDVNATSDIASAEPGVGAVVSGAVPDATSKIVPVVTNVTPVVRALRDTPIGIPQASSLQSSMSEKVTTGVNTENKEQPSSTTTSRRDDGNGNVGNRDIVFTKSPKRLSNNDNDETPEAKKTKVDLLGLNISEDLFDTPVRQMSNFNLDTPVKNTT